MSRPSAEPRAAVSWAAATWSAPVVPAGWFLVFLLVAGGGPDRGQQGDFTVALVAALVITAVGALLSRVGGAASRGLGYGLVAGGCSCVLPSVWVLLT